MCIGPEIDTSWNYLRQMDGWSAFCSVYCVKWMFVQCCVYLQCREIQSVTKVRSFFFFAQWNCRLWLTMVLIQSRYSWTKLVQSTLSHDAIELKRINLAFFKSQCRIKSFLTFGCRFEKGGMLRFGDSRRQCQMFDLELFGLKFVYDSNYNYVNENSLQHSNYCISHLL